MTVKATLSIFRAAEATPLDQYEAMEAVYSPEVLRGITKLYEAGIADGYTARVLFESVGTNGFSLIYAWFKKDFPLTAHLHDADCLYYVIGGELILGKGVASETVRAGDGFFVPSGHMYGYTAGPEGVEILEFRSVSKFNIQYKEAPPAAWDALAAVVAANKEQWKSAVPPERRVPDQAHRLGAATQRREKLHRSSCHPQNSPDRNRP
jgi:mannose-6-phosphate isomerase-like protein (cupin superfamily)